MVALSTPGDANQGHQTNPQQSNEPSMTTSHSSQDVAQRVGSSFGLLHDDNLGNHPTDSKDVAILRRLKLAILEGQHPYFKAKVDLSNLQDLVLTSGSRSTNPMVTSAQQPGLSEADNSTTTHPATQVQGAASVPGHVLRSPVPVAMDSQSEQGASETWNGPNSQAGPTQAPTVDVNMDGDETQVVSQNSEAPGKNGSLKDVASDNQRTPSHTLGRYTLHSPIESESSHQLGHKRKISDTPTLPETSDQKTDSEMQIKRESPPYQLSGSQSQGVDASSSSMASFMSSASTALTSEDGGKSEDAHGVDPDPSGYDPKYGDKAKYLQRQKVRSKMIESIEEKNRRLVHRPEERPTQKSPVRPSENGSRRGDGPNGSPVRGRDYLSRTHTIPPFRPSDANAQGVGSNNPRRTPPLDPRNERAPPSFETSPRGRTQASSFTRPISPPGKYPPRQTRDFSPPRDYRSQYLPYDDPPRPRPVVSSPPRGSPPREAPAPRPLAHRPSLDNFSSSFPRNESRSFDSRPRPPSPVFSDRPRVGSYSVDNNAWAGSARGLPPAPAPAPSRNSPPPRNLGRDHTPFGSPSLPTNPAAGYRPQGLPEPPSTRYSPYDPPPPRRDASWSASRDWNPPSRLSDPKPKLQDRLAADSAWSRDTLDSRPRDDHPYRLIRDDFPPRPSDDYASRYRREPSPPRYSDGLRAGFSRPAEVEGIRPMKRSRPDDGYAPPRGGPSTDRARYDLDRPLASDYYGREPPRRPDDEYEPRPRPPYSSSWAPP